MGREGRCPARPTLTWCRRRGARSGIYSAVCISKLYVRKSSGDISFSSRWQLRGVATSLAHRTHLVDRVGVNMNVIGSETACWPGARSVQLLSATATAAALVALYGYAAGRRSVPSGARVEPPCGCLRALLIPLNDNLAIPPHGAMPPATMYIFMSASHPA